MNLSILPISQKVKAEGLASLLDVPVMARDAVIDILALYMAVPREFSTAEIEFLAALAQAIQNASLYMALQDDMKERKDDVWSHRLWF